MNYVLQTERFKYKQIIIELLIPEKTFVKKTYKQQPGIFPYWSKIWPAAYAMAEFIVDNPDFVRNKKVLEIAAGLALPSLVAAKFAAEVCISDYAENAVNIAEQSVKHNNLVNTTAIVLDWSNIPQNVVFDIVLMSDVNYEPGSFDILYNTFKTLLDKGVTILLTTPQRLMAKPFIEMINSFIVFTEVKEIKVDAVATMVSVYILKQC